MLSSEPPGFSHGEVQAAYLELARREKVPLATLDAALASAARVERVALIGEEAE